MPNKIVYTGDVYAKPERLLRTVEFNHQLAGDLAGLKLSGERTLDQIFTEIFQKHTGRLFDPRGEEINKLRWFIDDAFGEDGRRWINSYKIFAHQMPRQRLQKRCVKRVTAIDFALTIHAERVKLMKQAKARNAASKRCNGIA